MEAKASLVYVFDVECPHCHKHDHYSPIITAEGDALRVRFRDIVLRNSGRTDIPCRCNECGETFTITSFLI